MQINRLFKPMLALAMMAGVCAPAATAAEETTGKPNVFIDYFWRPTSVDFNNAEQLRNNIIQAIVATNRVELIDVDSKSALKVEQERRESGELSDGDDMDRLKVMEEQGANFLIQGRITSWVVEQKTTDDGSPYYTSVINFNLKVIDPNTGKLVHGEDFKAGGELLNLKTGNTPQEAVMNVCRYASGKIKPFIDKAFPVVGTILDIAEQKKDKIESVYISLGSDTGVSEGDYFAVCEEKEIAGRKSNKVIGNLEVTAVEGGDISSAKVKKGGKEIKVAMDEGKKLVLKSMPKPKSIFDKAKDNFAM